MEEFINCKYEGERNDVGTMDGKGRFTFPNGTVYDGELIDGEFHGKGTLYFPGRGRYVAEWDHGSVISGTLFFDDNLEYRDDNWIYCSPEDRRYYCEVTDGLKPAGESYITPVKQENKE